MSSPFPLSPAGHPAGPLAALAQLVGAHGPANDPLTPGDHPDPFGGQGLAGRPGGGGEAEPLQILDQMIQLAKQYMNVEPDQGDVATMAKLLSTLQGYKAKDQADMQAALGNGSIARLVRKTP